MHGNVEAGLRKEEVVQYKSSGSAHVLFLACLFMRFGSLLWSGGEGHPQPRTTLKANEPKINRLEKNSSFTLLALSLLHLSTLKAFNSLKDKT